MLNVFIGYGCNLKCGYCLQAPARDREGTPSYKNKSKEFVKKILPIIKLHNVKSISYWGGEPLLYWRTISEIHEELIKEVKFEDVKIVSNGTLLTPEIRKTINRWKAFVVLSRHTLYGEPKWEEFSKVFNSTVSFLLHGKTLDPSTFINEIKEIESYTKRKMYVYMHWVRATTGCSPEYYIQLDQLKQHEEYLWQLVKQAEQGCEYSISLWRPHVHQWRYAKDSEFVPMCRGSHQIDVDLEGNWYNCHHTVNKRSKIGSSFGKVDNKEAYLQAERFVKTTECQTCPIKNWCRGNCHLSNTHEVDCQLSKIKGKILDYLDKSHKINFNKNKEMFISNYV